MLDYFKINSMKTNPGKFQFMLRGVKNIVHFTINVNGKIIPRSNEVKLLRITIDNELNLSISRIFVRKHPINYMPSGE